ncbi:hypothetical protein [Nocardia sp. NPDC051570]|uniref:hypothetical protein n=1 Tax=Nocardia sp. NPDC051570 TaxID=3364324 RepID=UPI0037A620B1
MLVRFCKRHFLGAARELTVRKGLDMESLLRKALVMTAGVLGAAAVVVPTSASAEPAPGLPPDPDVILGDATVYDMTKPVPAGIDFQWFSMLNPEGPGIFQMTFNEYMVPVMSFRTEDPDGHFIHQWNIPSAPVTRTLPPQMPALHSNDLDFAYDQQADAWHLQVHMPAADTFVDVYYSNWHPGAKMDPLTWDGEKVFWASGIGTAKVNGTIKFPSMDAPQQIHDWAGEQERMSQGGTSGIFENLRFGVSPNGQLSPGFWVLGPGHNNGYDYLQGGNPDGSSDQVFLIHQNDGSLTGIFAHTAADGQRTMCVPDFYEYQDMSDYPSDRFSPHTGTFRYPKRITTGCGGEKLTFTVTEPHAFDAAGPGADFMTTMSKGHTDVPGSVSTIQHLQNAFSGSFDGMPLDLPFPTVSTFVR